MTQKQLAELLGHSESFISYVEKGSRTITVKDLGKLAKIFDVLLGYFEGEPRPSLHFRAHSWKDYEELENIKAYEEFKVFARLRAERK